MFWDESDHEIAELNYLNGEKNGTNKQFYRDGKIKIEEHYASGVLDSVRRVWSDKGKLMEESFWVNGSNASTKYWNENGELISKATPPEGFDFLAVIVSVLSDRYQGNSTHSTHFNSLFKDDFSELIYLANSSDFNTNRNNPINQSISPNRANNPSISPNRANNPFGDGGNGGGQGGGNGPFDGNGNGTSGEENGEGDGRVRIRINDPVLPNYNTDIDLKIHLKLTVSGDGAVTKVVCVKNKTTTTDQTIIDDVIKHVIRQVKYKKDPEGKSAYCYLTVKVNAL